jgi:hypothetical protein
MGLMTAAEKAQMYEEAILKLLANPNKSYTVMGQTFQKQDINTLEKWQQHYERKAQQAAYGCKTVADVRQPSQSLSS